MFTFKYVFFYTNFPNNYISTKCTPNLYPTIYLINYSNTKQQSIVDFFVGEVEVNVVKWVVVVGKEKKHGRKDKDER